MVMKGQAKAISALRDTEIKQKRIGSLGTMNSLCAALCSFEKISWYLLHHSRPYLLVVPMDIDPLTLLEIIGSKPMTILAL